MKVVEKKIHRFECILWYEGDYVYGGDLMDAMEKILLMKDSTQIRQLFGTWVVPIEDLDDNKQYMRSAQVQPDDGNLYLCSKPKVIDE